MPKFRSEKYSHLTLQDDKGIWAQFQGGEFETSDAAVAKRLRSLPEEDGVTEVKASGKPDGDGASGNGK